MVSCLIVDCGVVANLQGFWFVQAFISTFLAILFLQSGLDKVFDFAGNLEWLKGHFKNSFLNGTVPMMLATITLVELVAGVTSAVGVVQVVWVKSFCWAFIGTAFSAAALVMLFFGQRVAKDYAGAGGLVPYFILTIINLYFLA
ncbi:DoxX family protein [Bacteroidota bacterium]